MVLLAIWHPLLSASIIARPLPAYASGAQRPDLILSSVESTSTHLNSTTNDPLDV